MANIVKTPRSSRYQVIPDPPDGGVDPLSTVLYVDAGTGTAPVDQDGSIGAPYDSIEDALSAIGAPTDASEQAEVWTVLVAPGTYTPSGNLDIPSGRRINLVALGKVEVAEFFPGIGGGLTINRNDSTEFDASIEPSLYVGSLPGSASLPQYPSGDTPPGLDGVAWIFEGELTDAGASATVQNNVFLDGLEIQGGVEWDTGGSPSHRLVARNVTTSFFNCPRCEAWHLDKVVATAASTSQFGQIGRVERCRFGTLQADTGIVDAEGLDPGIFDCYVESLQGVSATVTFEVDDASFGQRVPTEIPNGQIVPAAASPRGVLNCMLGDTGTSTGLLFLPVGGYAPTPLSAILEMRVFSRLTIGRVHIQQTAGTDSLTTTYEVLKNGAVGATITIDNEDTFSIVQIGGGLAFAEGDTLAVRQSRGSSPTAGATNLVLTLELW